MFFTWNNFPFQNFNEINLDWILSEMRLLKDEIQKVDDKVGDLGALETEDKSNIVVAINEVWEWLQEVNNAVLELAENVGSLSNLMTTDKSSIVNAINEVAVNLDNAIQTIQQNSSNIAALDLALTELTSNVGQIEDDLEEVKARVETLESQPTVYWGTTNSSSGSSVKVVDVADSDFQIKEGVVLLLRVLNKNAANNVQIQIGDETHPISADGQTAYSRNDILTSYLGTCAILIYHSGFWVRDVSYPIVSSADVINGTDKIGFSSGSSLIIAINSLINNNKQTVLLWENPSPTNNFDSQNVTIPSASLNDYKFYIILWGDGYSANYGGNGTILTRGNGTTLRFTQFSGSGFTFGYREVGYNEGSTNTLFSFRDAYKATIQWENIAQPHVVIDDNSCCIPYQIYGIK